MSTNCLKTSYIIAACCSVTHSSIVAICYLLFFAVVYFGFSPLNGITDNMSKSDLVENYFKRGYNYKELVHILLSIHSVWISIQQLHRLLRLKVFHRKGNPSPSNKLVSFIERQLLGSESCIGYRQMHQRCIQHGISASRKNVSIALKALDEEGVKSRRRKYLHRRLY